MDNTEKKSDALKRLKTTAKVLAFVFIPILLIVGMFAAGLQISYLTKRGNSSAECDELFAQYCGAVTNNAGKYREASDSIYDTLGNGELGKEELSEILSRYIDDPLMFGNAYLTDIGGTRCLAYNFWDWNKYGFMIGISVYYSKDKDFSPDGFERITDNFFGEHSVFGNGHE